MAAMPTNTTMGGGSSSGGGRPASDVAGPRSPSGSPLPAVSLNATTIALIRENEEMLRVIAGLQKEVVKQQVRLDSVEEARVCLADEVAELRNQLGLAATEASTSTGKVLNYKTAYTELQCKFDLLMADATATKKKLEEATERERLVMQSLPATARQEGELSKSLEKVLQSLKAPKSFQAQIQRIMDKLKDPALRPADRPSKLKGDLERLEANFRAYKPAAEHSMARDVDIPIRQCVYDFLMVILVLLQDQVGK